jgi:hypothetical protein
VWGNSRDGGRTCNPNYSGGRDQEDHGSKPAQANSSQDHIWKKPITKKGLVEWLKVKALSSGPNTAKKKKKKPEEKKKKRLKTYNKGRPCDPCI